MILYSRVTRRLALWAAWIGLVISAPAASGQELPVDPALKIGKLDNGLTYYIRENAKPENRAALRLVVDAGSILEDEDQRGLAHFVEHMAFNGTERFEKQELVDFLEGIGMRFGPDLNAYTGFDETVYMLELPLDDEAVVDRAFDVLSDWADGVVFAPEEVEKERGVVLEEWRLRRGAQGRLQDEQLPILFKGSRYAERLPIGLTEVIENAPREAMVRFYEDWYRPDLMAVIAVGDFDAAAFEARIRETFSGLEVPEGAPKRPEFTAPDHQETYVSVETDPELTATRIDIAYKRDASELKTLADYRRALLERLYMNMLNQRLSERMLDDQPPFLGAGVIKQSLIRSKGIVAQVAILKEGALEEGMRALLQEGERVDRDGFTAGELDRAKTNLLRGVQAAYEEREKTESSSHADEYIRHFLEDEAVPGIAKEFELTREALPSISLEEVNRTADDWITESNRVILFSSPEKPILEVPTEEDLLAIMETTLASDIGSYEDNTVDAALVEDVPEPGAITSEETIESLGLTKWTLSNGVRVLVKPTDFKNDEILFRAYSEGGSSLVPDEDYVSATNAGSLIGQSGLGAFDYFQLRKKLAGKIVSVSPNISELSEGLNGTGSPEDLESLLQLIYLSFVEPRSDERLYGLFMTQMREQVANRLKSPEAVFSDAVNRALYGNHPRRPILNEAYLEAVNLEDAFRIYQDRFADASDFTFVFVGAVDLERLRELSKRYLASLPNLDRDETWRDVAPRPEPGRREIPVEKGIEPKSLVSMNFFGDAEWSDRERLILDAAVHALEIRLRNALREDKGGTYGVNVQGGLSRYPEPRYSLSITFGCAPFNVNILAKEAENIIAEMGESGATAEELQKVTEGMLRAYEVGLKENGFWLSNLVFYDRHGKDPSKILDYPERVRQLTTADIGEALRRYFDFDNSRILKLYPEDYL